MVALAVSACASSVPDTSPDTQAETQTGSSTAIGAVTVVTVAPPVGSITTTAPGTGVQPDGFDTTAGLVTKADGTICEICVWLADTSDRRSRGLMFATDLGAAEAMAFLYPSPHTGTFWMKNTVMPLSIAFFSPGGEFLDAFDMPPCTTNSCPNYRTPTDFLIAVEVPEGELEALGLTVGSTFELLDLPCK